MVSESLRSLAALLFFVALAALGYFAASHWQSARDDFSRVEVSAPCDLRSGPCRHVMDGGVVEFAIEPVDIPLMKPLALRVRTEGLDVVAVRVEIRGLNMDMGLNRSELARDAGGFWRAETILPICSQRRMEWEAAVLVSTAQPFEVPFAFHTTRP